jgi:hypothetical protein
MYAFAVWVRSRDAPSGFLLVVPHFEVSNVVMQEFQYVSCSLCTVTLPLEPRVGYRSDNSYDLVLPSPNYSTPPPVCCRDVCPRDEFHQRREMCANTAMLSFFFVLPSSSSILRHLSEVIELFNSSTQCREFVNITII